jgi:hypothetical protein
MEVRPYRRFFQAPCKFDSERTALVFPATVLEQRLAEADSARLRSLEAQAQARDDFSLVFRLRRNLRTSLLPEAASGDEVAKLLSMHRRTLNRRQAPVGRTTMDENDREWGRWWKGGPGLCDNFRGLAIARRSTFLWWF